MTGFVFYAVTPDSLSIALKPLNVQAGKDLGNRAIGVLAGEATLTFPFGPVQCEIALHIASGQLTVNVKQSPPDVPVDAIRSHLQSALHPPAGAVVAVPPSITETGPPRIHEFGDSVVWAFHCPGCGYDHAYRVKPAKNSPVWKWNGSTVAPTFQPSLLVNGSDPEHRCHLFMTNGKIQFLQDCHHALAGKTVDCPAWQEDEEAK